MTETTLIASLSHGHVAKLIDESPTGQLLQPLDVAKAIVFLASDWVRFYFRPATGIEPGRSAVPIKLMILILTPGVLHFPGTPNQRRSVSRPETERMRTLERAKHARLSANTALLLDC